MARRRRRQPLAPRRPRDRDDRPLQRADRPVDDRRSTRSARATGSRAAPSRRDTRQEAAQDPGHLARLECRELLEYLVAALVDKPDAVKVEEFEEDDGTLVLELSVDDDDYGKVIGRGGRTAQALRTVVKAAAVKDNRRVLVDIVDVSAASRRGRVGRAARPRRLLPRHAARAAGCWTPRRVVTSPAPRARSCAAPAPTSADRAPRGLRRPARPPRRCAARRCWSPRDDAPPLEPDEWWADELEGCAVVDGDREVGDRRAACCALPSCEVLEVDGRRRRAAGPAGRRRGPLGRRRGAGGIDVDLRFLAMSEIDVFTLFPDWFDWFRAQRHVANALANGHALETRRLPRDHDAAEGRPGRRHAVRRRRGDGAARRRRRGGAARPLRRRPGRAAAAAPRDRADARRAAARRRARRRARRGGRR